MKSVLTCLPATETVCANLIVVERFKMSQITFISIHILANQIHIMTINQHNSVKHAFSVPNWSEMCGLVDVLTVLPLSPTRCITIYRRTDRENIMQELIYIYIYIEREIEIDRERQTDRDRERHINPLNIRYIFSRSIGNTENHVATLTCLEWMGASNFKIGLHQFNLRLHHFSQFPSNV